MTQNGSESDVDCGGSCAPCGVGGACDSGSDCDSGVCDTDECAAPTCSDGVENGDETGVDCGGTCPTICPVGCSAAPLSGCRQAGSSSFTMGDNADNAKDKLSWTWAKGEATTISELSDPTSAATDYRLCVYANGAEIAEAEVAGGITCGEDPCWTLKPDKNYTYKDKLGAEDGVTGLKLSAGIKGKASIKLKGKGANLPDITLPITGPLVVQMQNLNNDICFTATYTGEQIKKNDGVKGKLSGKAKLELP
jgi:hypothetical protein